MQDVTCPIALTMPRFVKSSFDARTHNKWQPKDVPDTLLKEIVDVMKMGPTSANCSPVAHPLREVERAGSTRLVRRR